MPRKKRKYYVASLDAETDPFKFQRIPRPFVWEFYCEELGIIEVFWGDDCSEQFIAWLETRDEEFLIYAHNGGKFDFHLLHKYLDNPIKIINARIVEAHIIFVRSADCVVRHRLRDSFAIMPFALKQYDKDEIDYAKLERPVREKNKPEILRYLHKDCLSLYQLVFAFVERFGPKLTIGSTAMKEIKARHKFKTMSRIDDAGFRPFYYGGRVQCFESGVINADGDGWKCFDVNSMYPKAMRDYRHPVNCGFDISSRMPDNFDRPFFLHFDGVNRGALPTRTENAGLSFAKQSGEFFACSHEIAVGLKYGLLDIKTVHECRIANETICFDTFVNDFYNEKVAAKASKDRINELFAKFVLNSGYGKFGQNPDNFADWFLNREFGNDEALRQAGYDLESEFPDFELWRKPSEQTDRAFFDVSIAASITSAARAMMLEGIQLAERPLYCDTDSLICKAFHGVVDPAILGAWKEEWTAPAVAIAGKKLYAAFDPRKPVKGKNAQKPIKLVSKGGSLTLAELIEVARGGEVEYSNPAPTFSLVAPTRFIHRKFRTTAENDIDDGEQITA